MSVQYCNKQVDETIKLLGSDRNQGLNDAQVKKLRETHGYNELEKEEKESIWEKIKEQFEDTLVRILLASAIISYIVSQFEDQHEEHGIPAWVEPTVIFIILILNACVAIYQDLDAEAAIDKLMDLQSPEAMTLRNGKWNSIEARELVPGDIVQVQQGDKIPADCRVLELQTVTFKTDQAILTGETNPVNKDTGVVSKTTQLGITDKTNYLFAGTLVNNGIAVAIVVETAMNTEIGKIQAEVQSAAKEKKTEQSPLKQKLDDFSEALARYIGYICILCWVMNIPQFWDSHFGHPLKGALYYFKVAIALAVAAIPEGLPAVITTCLALGSRRMAKHQAIIRKLDSVETLGCTTIICSDKTGTLTTNEMVVENFFVVSGQKGSEIKSFQVEGTSYNPQGNIQGLSEFLKAGATNIQYFSQCMALCNESKLIWDTDKKRVNRHGLPTEAALKVLNEKIGIADSNFKENPDRSHNVEQYNTAIGQNFEKLATLEFSRDRKSMSILMRDKQRGSNVMFIKGAPDYLLNASNKVMNRNGEVVTFDKQAKDVFDQQIKSYAKKGLRTLAICVKQECGQLATYNGPNHQAHKLLQDTDGYGKLEADPIFIGVVAVRDPPRTEVSPAIQKCKEAGISVVMITGDVKETANSIASDIGIIDQSQQNNRSLTGHEFEGLKESEKLDYLQRIIDVPSGLVFSRTDPKHKRQLVQLLGTRKQIVAMTGDGVNDAPALKQAQIGIAMGITGTEVAKEASDMVLADDNFSTIVKAVEEGRAIYANMKAFIRYMISSNIGEVISIFLSSMLGIPDGFNSIQLLWVNLVTDGLPATALSFNPPDPDVMKKPPRKNDEPLISGFVMFRYFAIGTYIGIATVGIFIYWYCFYDWSEYNHQLIEFSKLKDFTECQDWKGFSVQNFLHYDFSENPCLYFTWGKQKASTLSLTVLVMIEMLNAINALSDEASILEIGLFANPLLLLAISGSVLFHCLICYISFFENIFGTVSLTLNDWILVFMFSGPVILLDEILKVVARIKTRKELKERLAQQKKIQ